jgi:ABC-type antimicrobial peptide transport system permease subunit
MPFRWRLEPFTPSGSMLYGVASYDPGTLLAGVAILGTATVVATMMPVRKAVEVDPAETLRHQ